MGTLVASGNLIALTRAMFVSAHAATVLAVVLTYASAAGLAAAFVSARSSSTALDTVTTTARTIGDGDLSARVGPLDAGPELDRLAETLDRMAARLQGVRDPEQRVERTRRDLISAVSHDLRTPLANLRAMAEAIDEGVVDDRETFRRYAAEMGRAVGQLSSSSTLFELVQIDTIAIEAETDRVRLDDVVASALATVETEAERKGVLLSTELAGSEGTHCSPHLTRVLQNLLVNAVRHTPADGAVRIRDEGRPARFDSRWRTRERDRRGPSPVRLRPVLPGGSARAETARDSGSRWPTGSSVPWAARSTSPAAPIGDAIRRDAARGREVRSHAGGSWSGNFQNSKW